MFQRVSSLSGAMRFSAIICAAILSVACGPSEQNVQLHRGAASNTFMLFAESSMVKVIPDIPLTEGPYRETVEIAVAGGEVEAGQIIIVPVTRDLKRVEFSVSALKNPDGLALADSAVALSAMGYVETKAEAKLVYPVERFGWFPDPILPFVESFDVDLGKNQSLWLSIDIPAGQSAGFYRGQVTVSAANAEDRTIPVEVRVFGFDIPVQRSLQTTLPTFEDELARLHGEAWNREMYWRYADFLHAHRVNIDNIYRRLDEATPKLEDIERLAAGGQDAWTLRYIPHPGHRWRANPETYDEYVTTAIAGALATYAVLEEAGVAEWASVYLFDEVQEEHFDALRHDGERVREALPGVPLVTSARDYLDYGIASGVSDVIDGWGVPIMAFNDDEHLAAIERARANGDRITWINVAWPHDPYPNFFVEYDAIGARLMMGAMVEKYRPDAYGYWGTNYWEHNDHPITEGPYTDWNPFTGATNGDGSLYAPGEEGPLTTIRFENIRDGLEDYEYYRLLEKAIVEGRARGIAEELLQSAEALLTVPEEIVKAVDGYTRDSQLVEQHRLRIAEAIEDLSR